MYKFYKWRYRHLSEETYMAILSIIVGLLTGMIAVFIKNLTHLIQLVLEWDFIKLFHHTLYFIFPVIGIFLVGVIAKYIVKRSVTDSIPFVMYAITQLKSYIPSHHTWSSLITAPVTVGFGGSVGLEGPSAITGASVGTNLSKFLHLNLKQRNLLLAAATAGTFASIFKAPIAGIMFVIEIFGFDLTMSSLIPLILASVTSILMSYFFFGKNILLHYEINQGYILSDIPIFIIFGFLSALISIYFIRTYHYIKTSFDNIKNEWKKKVLAGFLLGITIYFFPALYGEGYEIINHILTNDPAYVIDKVKFSVLSEDFKWVILLMLALLIFKVISMSLTLSAGGVGGVFAPMLFTGSLAGYVFVLILNHFEILDTPLPTENFVLAGMAGSIAGIIHAPLTAVFLIAEITGGYELIVPIMLVSAISFLISKKVLKYNIYTIQLKDLDVLPTHNKDKLAGKLIEWKEVLEKDLITITPDKSLGHLVYNVITHSHRNIFPVVDKENHFLGIITLDDVRQIMFNKDLYDKIFVRDLMHKAPDVIYYKKDNFQKTIYKFQATGAWNLPVILENGTYVGFISKSKLLSIYRKKLLELTSD